jgi:hypothetical protein
MTSLLLNGLEGGLSPSSPPLLPALVPDAPDPDGQKMSLPQHLKKMTFDFPGQVQKKAIKIVWQLVLKQEILYL